jgi:hypothetical protein
VDRRVGINAIPSDPSSYLNTQQQLGLKQLKEFGWNTLCVRRSPGEQGGTTTILKNRHNNRLGILNEDGHLRLAEHLSVREYNNEDRIKSIAQHTKVVEP